MVHRKPPGMLQYTNICVQYTNSYVQMEPSPQRARQDPWRGRQRAESLAGCPQARCPCSGSVVQSAAQLEARQLAVSTAAQRQQQRQPEWQHSGQLDRKVSGGDSQLKVQRGWWFPCGECSSRSPAAAAAAGIAAAVAAAVTATWARQQQWRRRRKWQQRFCPSQQHGAAVPAARRWVRTASRPTCKLAASLPMAACLCKPAVSS